jgi:predicted alpha/beta superfamily hydrolase
MKKKRVLIILVVLLIFLVLIHSGRSHIHKKRQNKVLKQLSHSYSENVHILKDSLYIDYLAAKRSIAIYLPENYDHDTISYPVIYYLDGQSLFDQKAEGSELHIDEYLDSMGQSQKNECIVIGIYSSRNRLGEYNPFQAKWYLSKNASGTQHARWIAEKLKPWVDEEFRTKKQASASIIAGNSMGALLAFYTGMTYPHLFGSVLAASPSFWISKDVFDLPGQNELIHTQKYCLGYGEKEKTIGRSVRKMGKLLKQKGLAENQLKIKSIEKLGHDKETWEQIFREAYPWLTTSDSLTNPAQVH